MQSRAGCIDHKKTGSSWGIESHLLPGVAFSVPRFFFSLSRNKSLQTVHLVVNLISPRIKAIMFLTSKYIDARLRSTSYQHLIKYLRLPGVYSGDFSEDCWYGPAPALAFKLAFISKNYKLSSPVKAMQTDSFCFIPCEQAVIFEAPRLKQLKAKGELTLSNPHEELAVIVCD